VTTPYLFPPPPSIVKDAGASKGLDGFYDDDQEELKKSRLRAILGDQKVHYAALVEQLIFMEQSYF
jgi:hypothetical protein